jgi:Proteasome non-ATPase 26S subunit
MSSAQDARKKLRDILAVFLLHYRRGGDSSNSNNRPHHQSDETEPSLAVQSGSEDSKRALKADDNATTMSVSTLLSHLGGGVEVLFAMLTAEPEEHMYQSVLDKIFADDDAGLPILLDVQTHPYLHIGLSHAEESIRVFTIKQLGHALRSTAGVKMLLHSNVYTELLQLLCDEQVSVATASSHLLTALATSQAGADQLFSQDTFDVLRKTVSASQSQSVVKLRIFDLMCKVACTSDGTFAQFSSTPYLSSWLVELAADTSDVLLQMSLLEIVSQLLACKAGFVLLTQPKHMIVAQLSSFLVAPNDGNDHKSDPLISLGITAAFKFVEQLATAAPTYGDDFSWLSSPAWSSLPHALQFAMASEDDTMRAAAVSLVGVLASSVEGMSFLLQESDRMEEEDTKQTESSETRVLLWRLAFMTCDHSEMVKLAALHAISVALGFVDSENNRQPESGAIRMDIDISDTDTLQLHLEGQRRIFACVTGKIASRHESYLSEPFQNVRQAVLRWYFVLANHSFGFQFFATNAGIIEFLLDRKTESTKSGLEWKFKIVKALVHHPLFGQSTLIPDALVKQLQNFLKDGPYTGRISVDPQVALQSS